MKIQINTDKNIAGDARLNQHTEDVVERALRHLAAQITRVEVHLSDENSAKPGTSDKRCMMEARIEGRQPIAITHDDASLHQAIEGAASKLKNALEHTLGKRSDR